MRFPLALTTKIAAYIIGQKLRGTKKFATVLQLEPLHTCNLTCTGCGRIREYSTSLKDMMSLEDCLAAANECNAPMVSICGGEPLIYPHIEALVEGLLAQKRIVYICTNAMFMRKKMREWLASEYRKADSGKQRDLEQKIQVLQSKSLLPEKDAAQIRKGPKDPAKPTIGPSKWMYWNVHLDGLERTHDLIVEREGVFKECILAIKMAKVLGYQVATNTKVYKETDGHYTCYAELLERTEWDRYGVVNGVARDSRCENCMVHCGYEPTATLGLQAQPGDTWKTIKFNFGAKPKPAGRGSEVLAFNGVSSGNGHITGKRAEPTAQAS